MKTKNMRYMKTRLSMALAFLLVMVQGLWAQTPMTPAGENTWTTPMPAYQILLHADYWGEFAISYDLDGGVNHAENPSLYYEDETVTLKAPTKENNIFTGWTGSNGNEPQLEVSITQGSTGDKSFVAHWELMTPDPQQDPTIFAGFTATDGCGGFGGEDHSKLVDGLFAPGNEGVDWTKWCADGQHKSVPSGESESCWWVDFNSANPINVTGYILTTGNDNTKWGEGRNPNSWKIKAKLNAGDAWTTIATVTNDNTMQVADFTDFSFTLDQTGTYKYFRFMVYEPEYDNCMQLCEFRFTGNGGSTPEPADPEALQNELLQELWTALGEDVWTGYGTQTGVISYSRGGAEAFHASFMGGNYAFDLPFAAFTAASKAANTDGSYTYTLTCNLPAQTGMGQETLHVTLKNGEITGLESENAGIEMNKEEEISGWASLQNAFAQGGVIKLAADVADSNNEGALVVPAGKTVMLELNGHIINRALTSAVADGSVIINNGTLAIMGEGQITGGKTTGNGGGILNNGVLTLYGGEITGNVAALGGGVYNNGGEQGFWMTGGLIKGNTATTHPAIGGNVIFNAQAVVQINADGDKVSIAEAQASMSTLAYVQPAMPNYDDLQPADPEALQNELLQELWTALGEDVWTGYGTQTGVISYSRGGAEAFHASFMGGNYAFDLPFAAFTAASKAANTDGSYTYTLTCNLPAQTGMGQETLHVTLKNGEITGLESQNAGIEMTKEEEISGWASLQNAFAQGGVIKLAADVADSNNEGALVVPAGKTVMLELNGHIINRALTSAVADGSVIINNGTLAIMGEGQITGGKTTGNGGGILNNGVLTLYGGEITGNVAALGGGVYNNGGEQGFWMTGGLIKGNTATTHPAIGGEVIFNAQAVVQINADGDKVSIAEALASMSTLAYVQPAMPNYDDLQPADPEALQNELLQELWTALGEDVWTGYGTQTGVISYSRGGAEAFHASFMGGNYAFDLPFAAFTAASKAANTDGSYTYTLTCNLPAQTGMGQETLHVTLKNGEITGLESQNAGIEMNKEEEISGWAALQAAFAQGGVIKLAADVADSNNEGALVVPAGKTVMLELNGHIINRALTSAVADGSVIINNGTLAIMGEGQITGGKTTGNGGGILNNGVLTLYGGEITGNVAALGGGVYNNGGEQGFWMTGGLIKGNTATTHPAIGGEVIFNAQAAVQINADGDKVSIAEALASMSTLAYVQPAMPNYDDLQPADPEALQNELLQELWTALGEDVWTGYGTQTGVISYSRGGAEAFHASFMGGNYAFDLPFAAFTAASKAANTDGSYTYTLTCNLPAQTGMGQETLHVTLKNGEITGLESQNAGIEMQKEEGPVTGWAALQAAMTNGGVIKLGENVTAASTDAALTVPEGKTVVLELNGFNIDRALTSAVENGSVIVNNGTLAIMGEGQITGGKTTGNGGGILNKGIFTLYGGEITGNVAALGGGVYSETNAQFWMTGGLIHGNTATSNPAIGGDVIFNDMAAVQIDADGTQVTIEQALANMATYSYIKPVMPNYEDIPTGATIAANKDPQNDGTYYSTFYDSANNYILPEGVAAYVADLSGSDLVLTRIAMAGQVIPADNAVILVSSMANYSITKTNAVPVTFTANNDLEGVDEATPLTDIPGLTAQNCYVLSGTAQYGVGFYRINVGTLKAHKAFVQYTGNQNNAPKRMRFVFNQEQTATGMEDVQGSVQTTKILRNDQIIIIRNGVEYTINGQKVK